MAASASGIWASALSKVAMEQIAMTERIMRTKETFQWGAVFIGSWCGFLLSRNQASNFGQTRLLFRKFFKRPDCIFDGVASL
jgi:pyridoxine/pyridoxamine 5'-phosphate oxidase